jgi:hypothetical protein
MQPRRQGSHPLLNGWGLLGNKALHLLRGEVMNLAGFLADQCRSRCAAAALSVALAMGACSSSGGMFNNYAIVQGVDQIVPVDVYAPGCPPTPETLIHAIETLHQLIEDESILRRRKEQGGGANVHILEVPAGANGVSISFGSK